MDQGKGGGGFFKIEKCMHTLQMEKAMIQKRKGELMESCPSQMAWQYRTQQKSEGTSLR